MNENNLYLHHPLYPDIEIRDVYQAIWAVMSEISYVQKQKSSNLNYSFTSEAALIRAIRPFMEKYGITMAVVDQQDIHFETYQTTKGSSMNRTRLLATVRFTHAPSGTFVDVVAPGEGADSGDKSVNKANTCAYKYALRQTFVIETGDEHGGNGSEKSIQATIIPYQSTTNKNGKVKTYKDLLEYADKNFGMEEGEVKSILAKHRKFTPEDWEVYIADLATAAGKAN